MKIAVFFAISIVLFICGCSKEPDCFVADSIKEIKLSQLNDSGYFLYLRTTGFNEKESFFELFNAKASFDDCGQTSVKPVSQVHVDDTKGFPIKLDIYQDKIDVVYSAVNEKNISLESIAVEFHGN